MGIANPHSDEDSILENVELNVADVAMPEDVAVQLAGASPLYIVFSGLSCQLY